MKKDDINQAWILAYGLSFAVGIIAGEWRGGRPSPEELDARAREFADKAMSTVKEKLAGPPERV